MFMAKQDLTALRIQVGQLNDYNMLTNPNKSKDSRWVHRPACPQALYDQRNNPESLPGMLFAGMMHLIKIRKETSELGEWVCAMREHTS